MMVRNNEREKYSVAILLLVAILLIFLNIIGSFVHGYIDLTEDKRFTLTKVTKELVTELDEVVYVRVLLEGDLPAGFKRLRAATEQLLREFRSMNSNIQYEFEDPTEGDAETIKGRRNQLAKIGVVPTALKYFDGKEFVQKAIYPQAIVSKGGKTEVVYLLEEQLPGMDEQLVLNNSVSLLEYKFANAIQRLNLDRKLNIAFTTGHSELEPKQTVKLERELRRFYNTGRLNLDSLVYIDERLDLLIVAGAKKPMSLKNQFKIDQYLMNGGKVIWLVETMDASLDSIAKYKFYVPRDYELGFDQLLFKYGVRIQPNLLLDLECTAIPQIVGMSGDKPQTMMFPWYYHPVITPDNDHPIVKNISPVNMYFPSTLDTVSSYGDVKKTVLLRSSKYSRIQFNPVRLNFEILKVAPDPSKFTKSHQAVAMLLEGEFQSAFKNRVSDDFRRTLKDINMEFKEKSIPTKQLIVSDADFVKNLVNPRTEEYEEIGFNKWELKYFKGNKDFMLNAIEYMLDSRGLLESRTREVKLRLLDAVRVKNERKYWQIVNIVVPILILSLFGLLFTWYRRFKFGKRMV